MTSLAMPSPLVGRDGELGILRQHLHAALGGQGSLVLIGGEAGIGKTALAAAICQEAMEQDVRVLVGRSYDRTETPPYGPWMELFGRYRPTDELPPLPVAFSAPGTVGAVVSQADLFQQVLDFFTAVAARRPLVVLLDDLHWADPASLDVVRVLARSLSALPLLLLATYRSDELTHHHPLYDLLPLLVREAAAARLDLHRLPQSALRTLVETRYTLAEQDTLRLVSYLHERAEGNALFTIELLRTLEEQEALFLDADGWRIGDLHRVTVPTFLRQVIDGRVRRLGDEARWLLAVAAVIGQDVSLDVWATVSESDAETLLTLVERAGGAGLLDATSDGTTVRFAHALIREALFEGILPPRRRRLHQRVGETLASQSHPDPDTVADHFQRAGDARAVEWLIAAGERAQRALSDDMAAERYAVALAALDRNAVTALLRAELFRRLGYARQRVAPRQGSLDLDQAMQLATEAGHAGLVAAITFDRGLVHCQAGDIRHGLAELRDGVAALEALPVSERIRLATQAYPYGTSDGFYARRLLVQWLGYVGRFDEALILGEPLLAHANATGQPVDFFRAIMCQGLAFSYAALGRPAEARHAFAFARMAYVVAGRHPSVSIVAAQELVWVALPYEADDLAQRHLLAVEAKKPWVRADGLLTSEVAPIARLPIALLEGRWDEVRSLATPDEAAEFLGPLVYAQGDTARAWSLVTHRLPEGCATVPGDTEYAAPLVMQRLAATLAMSAGNLALAKDWLEAHDRWLAWSGAVLGQSEGQALWAQYHREKGDRNKAREHAARALALATAPRLPLALLAAHRLLGELETEAERFDAAAEHLDIALALAAACAAPFERARTLLALAECHGAAGDTEVAVAMLAEVRAICLPLGALPTLAKADALAARLDAMTDTPPTSPAGLSAREVEVLRLIAAGQTNREIAATLSISVKTVLNHVTHILTKTNLPNRAAAVAFAHQHNLIAR